MTAMNKYIKIIMLWAVAFFALPLSAQISRISGTVSDEFGGIPGIQVKELDANNRIVSSAITDANGNFTMTVKNQKNKLVFHGMGYTDKTFQINKTVYKVNMAEAVKVMKEAVIVAKKKAWPSSRSTRPCRVRLPVWTSWPTPVTWVRVQRCACAVPPPSTVTHSP